MDNQIERKPNQVSTTIANGQTTSGPLCVSGYAMGSLFLPAAMTGATMTVLGSYDGLNFFPKYQSDGATAVGFGVIAGAAISLPTECFEQPFIELVSGSAEGAARTLTVTLAS